MEAAATDGLVPLGRRRRATSWGWRASAPRRRSPTLYEHFGFTPENVAARARSLVEKGAGRLMQIGFIGLGKMGGNMVHRILRDSGHEVVAWDPADAAVQEAAGHGAGGGGVARGRWSRSWSLRATCG